MKLLLILIALIAIFAFSMAILFKTLADRYLLLMRKRHITRFEKAKLEKKKKPNRPDEFLSKDQKKEQKQFDQELEAFRSGVELYDPENKRQDVVVAHEQQMVVDIAKPVGRFSAMIAKQKMGFYLAVAGLQASNTGKPKGFWQIIIEAQAKSRSFEKSQGR